MIPSFLLPDGCDYFIAGGWAACPAFAADRDVWVIARGDAADMRKSLIQHFENFLLPNEWVVEADDRLDTAVDGYGPLTLKVARVAVGDQFFHILVTSATVEEVIAEFDISTHQIAITKDGTVVKGTNWTPTSAPPVMLKQTPTTLARLEKIAARYGHTTATVGDAFGF